MTEDFHSPFFFAYDYVLCPTLYCTVSVTWAFSMLSEAITLFFLRFAVPNHSQDQLSMALVPR